MWTMKTQAISSRNKLKLYMQEWYLPSLTKFYKHVKLPARDVNQTYRKSFRSSRAIIIWHPLDKHMRTIFNNIMNPMCIWPYAVYGNVYTCDASVRVCKKFILNCLSSQNNVKNMLLYNNTHPSPHVVRNNKYVPLYSLQQISHSCLP